MRRQKRKWIWLSILAALLVIFGLYRYFVYIQQDTWNQEDEAVQKAKQYASIVKVNKTWKSVWDQVCWVVEGVDESGETLMVWIPDSGELHSRKLSEGKSEQQIRAIIKEALPEIRVVKLDPGIYEGQYVWQLFYKEKEHYYYQFFHFEDGTALPDKFTLPNR